VLRRDVSVIQGLTGEVSLIAPPLEGLQVIEISTYVAGPSCGLTLANLGADVIRIDPIGGATDYRRLPLDKNGDSLYWSGLNRAKQSLEINTALPEGKDLVRKLLGNSGSDGGVLVTNAVGQEWLRYENLISSRPDLIMVHIEGRSDGKPAVDYTINCEVGLPLITGPTELERPVNHVLPAWDLLTGLHAAIGVLGAERRRSRSGQGAFMSVSLADVAVSTMGQLGFLSDASLNGRSRLRDGNYLYGSFGCDFETRDGRRVMIVALTDRQWKNLVTLTGTSEVIGALETAINVDLSDEETRYRYREVLVGLFRTWFDQRDFADIARALDENRVLWGPYRSVEDLIADPQSILNLSSIIDMVERSDIGTYPAARGVLRSPRWIQGPAVEAHRLGFDTRSLLRERLDIADSEVDSLQRRGVVGGI
jgi:2-methylfumaryl-CoA isomerase